MMPFNKSIAWLSLTFCTVVIFLLSGFGRIEMQDSLFRGENGEIYFKSDAPLEMIEARSDILRGIINPEKGTFAFSVPINSFKGFNSPLQKEHFNENYLESSRFPNGTFRGRIIEEIDFTQNGDYTVRAKGQLSIHGIEQERIIKSEMSIRDGKIEIRSSFSIPLIDHDIKIPKIVYQKIAEEIYVEILLTLTENSA